MNPFNRVLFSFALLLSLSTLCVRAQQIEIDPGDTGNITIFPPSTAEVRVTFTKDLDQDPSKLAESLAADNITLRVGGDGGRTLRPRSASPEPGSFQQVLVSFDYTKLTTEDTVFRICFAKLNYTDAGSPKTTTAPVCASIDPLTPANVKLKKALLLEELKKTPKTSEEQNIFASGFVAKGESGDAEGGAIINLNGDLGVRGLSAMMRLNKATAENADPKNFEAGLTYRSTYLFGRANRDKIRALLNKPDVSDATADGMQINSLVAREQSRPFAGLFFDFTGKLEGEALNFDVTNAVADGMVQLVSPVKRAFGTNKASVKYRLLAGVEAGKNLNNNDEVQAAATPAQLAQLAEADWISRFKVGGRLSFYYRNPESTLPFKRVELDLQAVNRYLALREVMFDKEKKMNILTDKGNKPWLQADLKFFFTDPPEGTTGFRSGFKVSYNRGSLPPVFAQTRSFQFGLIFETVGVNKSEK